MAEGGIIVPQNLTNSPRLYVAFSTMIYSDPLKDLKFEWTRSGDILPGSFRQELIYNGRSGSTIRFLYREIKDSYLRAPFTQEATYDLANSDVIGFKGARLKVVEATNSKIRYSVLKTFD